MKQIKKIRRDGKDIKKKKIKEPAKGTNAINKMQQSQEVLLEYAFYASVHGLVDKSPKSSVVNSHFQEHTKRITINPLITRNNGIHFHKILNSLTCIFDICIQPFQRTKEISFSIGKKTINRLFFGTEWRHLEFKELIILCIIIISGKSIRKPIRHGVLCLEDYLLLGSFQQTILHIMCLGRLFRDIKQNDVLYQHMETYNLYFSFIIFILRLNVESVRQIMKIF